MRAFQLILGRAPESAELKASRQFVAATRARMKPAVSQSAGEAPPGEWLELCRALYNLNDFVYVD
jgi:hypothetical protein